MYRRLLPRIILPIIIGLLTVIMLSTISKIEYNLYTWPKITKSSLFWTHKGFPKKISYKKLESTTIFTRMFVRNQTFRYILKVQHLETARLIESNLWFVTASFSSGCITWPVLFYDQFVWVFTKKIFQIGLGLVRYAKKLRKVSCSREE